MPSSIIRARTVVTEPADRRNWRQIEDGAVLQRDGVVAEIGPSAELIAKYPAVPILGTGRQVLLPGFVNAHHHVGLTPVQLGSPDMPLELWFVTRLVARRVDLYLDTLYSAFEMIASGITTVQHLHGWVPGGPEAVEAGAGQPPLVLGHGARDAGRLIGALRGADAHASRRDRSRCRCRAARRR